MDAVEILSKSDAHGYCSTYGDGYGDGCWGNGYGDGGCGDGGGDGISREILDTEWTQ